MEYGILCLVSFVLGGVGAWFISRFGSVLGVLDRANHRSSHDGVVPKGGGIGILAAFFLVSWALHLPALFWISISVISLLSLYGDRREIAPKLRLILQFAAGILLLAGVFYWEDRTFWAYLMIPLLGVYVVGTANYYNFMDGINGIAGVTGVVGFGLIVLFGAFSNAPVCFVILAGCMAFACLGFLPFNMRKARVFMGDVGSVLLGFVFAGLAVGLARSLNDFVVLCSFLFPFYADELQTEFVRVKDEIRKENQKKDVEDGMIRMIRMNSRRDGMKSLRDWMIRMIRMIRMESLRDWVRRVSGGMGVLLTPHRRHVYQLLANEMGIAHWKVSVGYGVLQAVVGVGALMVRDYGTGVLVLYLGGWFLGFWGVGRWVRKKKKDECLRHG